MWSLTLWMDDFLCIDAHYLEHLGPIFSDLPQISKNTNTCITKLSVGLYPWVKFHLMQNVEFNTMDEFVYPCPLFGFFPWLAPFPKYNKTGVITRPSDGLTLVSFSIKSWVKHLQWLFMYDSVTLIWGIWVQTPQIFSMPQILYNRWPSDDLETTWVRRRWMWNIKLKTFHYLYMSFPMNWGIWARIF